MTVFNAKNQGYVTKKYPLFMGEQLGLFDTVNVAYPAIEKLYQQQLAQVWNEHEVDLTQDRMDMLRVPKETADLMVKTLSWQHLADSVAAKSIAALLIPFCTNSELEGMLTIQSFFEIIHSRTYSHIVKQTFVDPNKMIEQTYNDVGVLLRSEAIVKAFDELESLPKDAPTQRKKEVLLEVLVALFALEGIAFMSSFAVTFAITETDVFQGIGALVAKIAADEALHTRMDATVLGVILKDPEWKNTFERMKPELKVIVDAVVNQEMQYAEYLFSEGRNVIGLNAALLKEYTLYMAYPIYKFLGLNFDYQVIEENPLPYMAKYIDPSQMQSANQEIQNTAYNIGVIENDTLGLDLDMEF